jgi:hypothetical protein
MPEVMYDKIGFYGEVPHMMTPNDIEIILHYYTTQEPHPRKDAFAVVESTQNFINNKILEHSFNNESGYEVTPKGEAYIKLLLSIPFPEEVFLDQYGNTI